MSTGGLFQVRARKHPETVALIPNWSPVLDLASVPSLPDVVGHSQLTRPWNAPMTSFMLDSASGNDSGFEYTKHNGQRKGKGSATACDEIDESTQNTTLNDRLDPAAELIYPQYDRIFVCTGREPYGGIAELRNGLECGVTEISETDMEITRIWAVADLGGRGIFILASSRDISKLIFHSYTSDIFGASDDGLQVEDLHDQSHGLCLDKPTLAVGIIHSLTVQVTAQKISLASLRRSTISPVVDDIEGIDRYIRRFEIPTKTQLPSSNGSNGCGLLDWSASLSAFSSTGDSTPSIKACYDCGDSRRIVIAAVHSRSNSIISIIKEGGIAKLCLFRLQILAE